jgi:hypothetical protein
MAITTTNRRATFVGNDTATVFPFNFKVFTTADLLVVLVDTGGNLTTLAMGTDYTAALNANQDTNPGGSITLTAGPLASTYGMIITSAVAELQPVILTNLGGFFPDVLNTAYDRAVILIQQLQLLADQSIKLNVTDELTSAQLPPAAQRAGKFLYFGADGSVSLVSQAPSQALQFNFAGPLTGTKDGDNKIFTITNNGSPIGVAPVQALVWQNMVKIPGLGYTFGPAPGDSCAGADYLAEGHQAGLQRPGDDDR